MINKEMIDLRYVEQIVDSEQVTALGYCMRYAQKHLMNGKKDLRQVIMTASFPIVFILIRSFPFKSAFAIGHLLKSGCRAGS